MDIRGIIGNFNPLQVRSKTAVDRAIKSDSATADRDANGQLPQDSSKEQKKRPPLNKEQFKKAMENLQAHPIIKEHQFRVESLIEEEDIDGNKRERKFLILKDPTGRIIRKIPEHDLWNILDDPTSDRGQVLHKSA